MTDPDDKVRARVLLQRRAEFTVWVGSIEGLVRINEIIREALAESKKLGSGDEPATADGPSVYGQVSGHGGSFSRIGDLPAVLAEADAREIGFVYIGWDDKTEYWSDMQASAAFHTWVNLGVNHWYRRRAFRKGVELSVTGPDRSWVLSTFTAITEEVRKGVPWYSGVYYAGICTLFPLALLGTTMLLVGPLNLGNLSGTGSAGEIAIYVVPLVVGTVLALTFCIAAPVKYLRVLEIVSPGGRTSLSRIGSAALAVVGLALAVVGLLVSL